MINRCKQHALFMALDHWRQTRHARRLLLCVIGVLLLALSALAPVAASSTAVLRQQPSPLSPLPPTGELTPELTSELTGVMALLAQATNNSLAKATTLWTETVTAFIPKGLLGTSPMLEIAPTSNTAEPPQLNVSAPITSSVVATSPTNRAPESPLVTMTSTIAAGTPETITNNALTSPLVVVTVPVTSNGVATSATNSALNSPLVVVTAPVTSNISATSPTNSAASSPLLAITGTVLSPTEEVTTPPALVTTLTSYLNRGQTSLVLVAAVLVGLLVVIGQLLWRQR